MRCSLAGWTLGDAANSKNSLPKPYRVFLFVFPLKYGLLDFPLDPLFRGSYLHFLFKLLLQTPQPAIFHPIGSMQRYTPSIPIFFFAPNSVFWPAGWLRGKTFPQTGLDWSCENAQEKSKSHELPACLTTARTPREINTKFQSHKNVPIAQTHDQREETFNSTSLAYFSS